MSKWPFSQRPNCLDTLRGRPNATRERAKRKIEKLKHTTQINYQKEKIKSRQPKYKEKI